MELYKLPKILILHLKRFKIETIIKKNTAKINFPEEGLDMSPFFQGEDGIYDLFAVINHYGNVGYGHYTAYAKSPISKKWSEFND